MNTFEFELLCSLYGIDSEAPDAQEELEYLLEVMPLTGGGD